MTALIKLDGKTIGLAESDSAGLGELAWFHANVHAYSMAHAIEHEGYSVETVDDVNCHDVKAIIETIAARLGITMDAEFVPFSLSRNAKPKKGEKPWRSLNWRVTLKLHGKPFLTTDYSQGVAYIPNPAKLPDQSADRQAQINAAIETGRLRHGHSAFSKAIPCPSIGDVLQSLASDSDVIDHADFENWAGDFGYDIDSREVERIYRACLETATKLRAALGQHALDELRLAASFN